VIGFDLGSTGCQTVDFGSFAETGNSRRTFQSDACKRGWLVEADYV